MIYQMVELEEGVEAEYLGVYKTHWRHGWGPPSVGFVEQNVFNLMITYLCAHCGGYAEVPFLEIEVLDSGTILVCNRCGEDSVVGLDTPGKLQDRYEELKALQELVAIQDSELAEARERIEELGVALVMLDCWMDWRRRYDDLLEKHKASQELLATQDSELLAKTREKNKRIKDLEEGIAYWRTWGMEGVKKKNKRIKELEAVVRARDFELEVKLADERIEELEADTDYWRTQCMRVAEELNKRILELEDQLIDASL